MKLILPSRFLLFFLTLPFAALAVPTASPPPPVPIPAVPNIEMAKALGNVFANVAEKVSPSVVVINVVRGQNGVSGMEGLPDDQTDPYEFFYRNPHKAPFPPRDQSESQGSGFIIRSDGYIFTNNHVIQGATQIKVKLKDGRMFDAQVVGVPDEKTDVAVIKIDAKGLPAVEFGDSDAIRPGEWTIAIGAPFNLDYSVTVGVLSGKVRDRLGAAVYEEYLQTQATINPGNSGGPLLDIDGKVIGINTLIKTRQGSGFTFYNANVGFAIPIRLAERIGKLLITKGKVERPWIGVDIRTFEEAVELKDLIKGVTKGVLVTLIHVNTPAYQSGLKPGDVITLIDGVPVTTARELQKQVLEKKIGQTIRLSVVRDGSPLTMDITTGLQPSNKQASNRMPSYQQPSNAPVYGMVLQPLDRELIEQFGLNEKQGLMIIDVEEDSPAARSGLVPGVVITEMDGKKIASIKAFKELLKKADSKHGSLLQVSRDGSRSFVVFYFGRSSTPE